MSERAGRFDHRRAARELSDNKTLGRFPHKGVAHCALWGGRGHGAPGACGGGEPLAAPRRRAGRGAGNRVAAHGRRSRLRRGRPSSARSTRPPIGPRPRAAQVRRNVARARSLRAAWWASTIGTKRLW